MQLPTVTYEKQIWKRGYKYIAGIDEVGRGCFAGPVVAAAVAFAPITNYQFSIFNQIQNSNDKRGEGGSPIKSGMTIPKINDSKKLNSKQREIASKWIKENCLAWGIGEASASTINRIGIVKATEMAFRKAIKMANDKLQMTNREGNRRQIPDQVRHDKRIDFLLIDAFYIPHVKGLRRKNQKAIVKGDSKSISIAAASIIAKVYRDQLMEKIGSRQRYKKYDWISNKGYGTKTHLEAIKKYGTNGYHRRQFVNTYLSKTNC
jgi:ribonuclease HII